MNALSKLVLFVGIAGVGLYCCGKIMVEQPPGSTQQSDWDFLTKIDKASDMAGFEEMTELVKASDLINSADESLQAPDQTVEQADLELSFDEPRDAANETWTSEHVAALSQQGDHREIISESAVSKVVKSLPSVNMEDDSELMPSVEVEGDGESLPLPTTNSDAATVSNPFFQNGNAEVSAESPETQTWESNGSELQPEYGNHQPSLEIPMMESIQRQQQATTDSSFQPTPGIEVESNSGDPVALFQPRSEPVVQQTTEFVPESRPVLRSESRPAQTQSPVVRTSQTVENRAQQHIEYGKSLARRGAVFAARQEFIQSLRLIADSHDINSGTRNYTGKLAAGLQALAESDDFVAVDSEQQLQMDVRSIVASHTTKVIDPEAATRLSPIQAMQGYYTFAATQIGQAVGESRVASEALHSLGKLLTTAARFDVSGKPMDRTKAMVMHQVAVAADSTNHLSANELGVLLARNGSWYQAAELFGESLKRKQTATTWKNLAMAHNQIARLATSQQERNEQTELAQLAMRESQMMGGHVEQMAMVPSGWATATEFNASAAMPEMTASIAEGGFGSTGSQVDTAQKPPRKKLLHKVKDWF